VVLVSWAAFGGPGATRPLQSPRSGRATPRNAWDAWDSDELPRGQGPNAWGGGACPRTAAGTRRTGRGHRGGRNGAAPPVGRGRRQAGRRSCSELPCSTEPDAQVVRGFEDQGRHQTCKHSPQLRTPTAPQKIGLTTAIPLILWQSRIETVRVRKSRRINHPKKALVIFCRT
jgi:hypothetical protein